MTDKHTNRQNNSTGIIERLFVVFKYCTVADLLNEVN